MKNGSILIGEKDYGTDCIAYLKPGNKNMKFIYKGTIIKKIDCISSWIFLKVTLKDTIFIIKYLIKLGFYYRREINHSELIRHIAFI